MDSIRFETGGIQPSPKDISAKTSKTQTRTWKYEGSVDNTTVRIWASVHQSQEVFEYPPSTETHEEEEDVPVNKENPTPSTNESIIALRKMFQEHLRSKRHQA